MNKNSNPMQEFFPYVWLGKTVPLLNFSKLLELSETIPARNLILGMHVNIDKASSRRYDITR